MKPTGHRDFESSVRSVRANLAVTLAVVAGAASVLTAVAGAGTTAFELVFHGSHPAAVHEGPFTASAPFCAEGYAADRPPQGFSPPGVVIREHTCGDGSGIIAMRITDPPKEHVPGGNGTWKILEGSGRYARLRGHGTWTSSGGDHFRSVLTGIADFDTAAPTVVMSRATARKLPRPRGAYVLRTSFAARDDIEGNAVSYRVTVSARGVVLAARRGKTTSGPISLSLRIRPPTRARAVRIEISASDPLENVRTISRSLTLRSR
jgi:hypothetical protein